MESKRLRELIRGDVRAKAVWLYGSADGNLCVKAFFTDGTFAMVMYRCMQGCVRRGWSVPAMVFNKLIVWFGGCVIGRGADFGPEFVLIHSQGVVINTGVKGGAGVKIEHQVTIGAEKGAAPVLGDHVFVGAGAKVLGGIRVGNDVRIGANAVVVDDIPDGVTAVGIPARPVSNEHRTANKEH